MVKDRKILYLEVLRVVSLFAIVFNHTAEDGFFLFAQEELFSFNSWLYCFFSIGCKYGVYIFFMISVALLLGKEESLETVLKKRVLKYLIIFVVWEAFNYLYLCITENNAFSISYFLRTIYSYDLSFNFSYWFILEYICFLLVLPILRIVIKKMDEKLFKYVITLFVIFEIVNFLPLAISFPYITPHLNAKWLSPVYIIYPIIGYYLHNKKENTGTKSLLVLIVASVLSIVLCSYLTMRNMRITGNLEEWNDNQLFHTSFVFLQASTLFLLAKKCLSNINISKKAYKCITTCSSLVFGIYLIHLPIIKSNIFVRLLSFFRDSLSLNCILSCWLTCLIIIIILGIIVYILKKIPYINRII